MLCSRGEFKKILNLPFRKAAKIDDILENVLMANIDIYLKDLTALVNDCFEKGVFQDELKLVDVSIVSKKGHKENCKEDSY